MFSAMRNRKRKGFSLMELILVVAIMAILAGVLTPMVFASKRAAQDAKALSELDAIATACRAYYSDHNTMAGITMDLLAEGGYISQADPVDPWGNAYDVISVGTWTDGVPESDVVVGAYSLTDPDDVTAVLTAPADATSWKSYTGLKVTVMDLTPTP